MAREANFLCQSIESRQEELRKSGNGREILIDNAKFSVIKADRNIVFRIKKDYSWYLKMPRSGGTDPILREIAGAENITKVLAKEEGYLHPAVVRGSVDFSYVLYSEIFGKQLNIAFYGSSFIPFMGRSDCLKIGFHNFGQILGVLHRTNSFSKDLVATPDLVRQLQNTLEKVSQSDSTLALIESYLGKNNIKPDPPRAFIHGNLRMDNILLSSDKVSFIDFENCGYGSPYEDLSRPVSQLTLTRSIFGFPWKLASQALSRFLESYKSNLNYDRERLLQYVTLRVSLYYIEIMTGKTPKPKISGLPIRRSCLQKIISELISGNIEKAIPGVMI